MKKVDEKVAIETFTKFLKKFKAKELRRGEISEVDIKDDYIDAIESIQDGFLIFDDKDHPSLTLRKPLTTGDDETAVKEVTFRTRIRPSDKANIMSGLEVQKDVGKFSLRYAAYITQLSIKELDLLDRDDYDTIQQVCSVF